MLLSTCVSLAAAVGLAAAFDEGAFPWQPPAPGDVRAPCPALNTLANHGLLPRDGKNIDLDRLIFAAYNGFSLARDASTLVGQLALTVSTTGNASTFNLDDLDVHDPQLIEHDGSMTRNDTFWGDNHSFNTQAWNRTLANWGDNQTITFAVAAAERDARFAFGRATNPEFNTTFANMFSLLEYALILSAFGDVVEGNGNATLIKSLFVNERLPTDLGFVRNKDNLTVASLTIMSARIEALL